MTGTLETSLLSPNTRCLIVEDISGRKIAGGRRITIPAAQASATADPRSDRRARRRSQRWHSANPPGGRVGMAWVAPQSAQVMVTAQRWRAVQEEGPESLHRRRPRVFGSPA